MERTVELNDFQKEISFEQIYVKNEEARLEDVARYDRLRILSWNIERGIDPDSLAAYINELKPHLVCLQEVDWRNQRTNNADVLDHLARSTSMMGLLGIEFVEIDTPHRPKGWAGGGVQGNAILTRIRPKRSFRVELPVAFDWANPPESHKEITRREKRIGARFALCVEFDYLGKSLIACSTHFEDKAGGVAGRFAQFKTLSTTLYSHAPENAGSIIAGDFNSLENWLTSICRGYVSTTALNKPRFTSECRWWKKHLLPQSGYLDPFTCNNWTYKRWMIYRERLDWVAVRNCRVLQNGVGDFNTSDHRPIWAELAL